MADTEPNLACCANCAKTNVDLKHCAKCRTTRYCCRDCQKADWKTHKALCVINSAAAAAATAATGGSTESPATAIDKPFHRLHAKTWLYDRREQDTYELLIDTYRLRMEDNYTLEGEVDEDSVYNEAANGLRGFRRFLNLAEKKSGLLPSWWSREKRAACEHLGMQPGWSSLASAIEKHDVVEHYGGALMPMQLRMFGEQVYGRGPGGQAGAPMLQIQMMAERGGVVTSHIDASART